MLIPDMNKATKTRMMPSMRFVLHALIPLLLLAQRSQSFCTRTYTISANGRDHNIITQLSLQEDEAETPKKKEVNEDDSYSWAELQADERVRQLELNSSRKIRNTMLLPQRIAKAITTLGWSFVITGIVLNSLGFAWVERPEGGIGVGTLDQRDFQREMNKRVDVSSKTISRINYDDLKDWVSLAEEEQQRT